MGLDARDLTLGYGGPAIVEGLSVTLPPRQVTALIGPNGSGKSTVMRALARLLRPRVGAVYLDGAALSELPTRAVAQRLALLPQQPEAPAALTVGDVVSYGRFPYRRLLGGPTVEDREAIEAALWATELTDWVDRPVGALSGGQRQRVWIAMALAQRTDLLLLDEPTTFLDLAHQLDVLRLLRRLADTQGKTIALVIHDVNLAARFADHLVALKAGRVVAEGTPRAVMTPAILGEVFGVDVAVMDDPREGAPQCIAYGGR
ncbi:MAG: ABC transporter ATP-binding protein [Myxococcales bacterium]|nr:ABC transporter ATP-binding protein [Myxococcales bacterium]MCB9537379.1 ABC transporter ATP-binding protein [Myxococcales bacterium]